MFESPTGMKKKSFLTVKKSFHLLVGRDEKVRTAAGAEDSKAAEDSRAEQQHCRGQSGHKAAEDKVITKLQQSCRGSSVWSAQVSTQTRMAARCVKMQKIPSSAGIQKEDWGALSPN